MLDRVHPFQFSPHSYGNAAQWCPCNTVARMSLLELYNDPLFAALSSLLHFAANHALTHSAPESQQFLHFSSMCFTSPVQQTILQI